MKNIYGIGNPLIDILSSIKEEDLNNLSLHKGTMHLIDKDRHHELLNYLNNNQIKYTPGGSCPNTMVTLASLGVRASIAGGIGNDELATIYRSKLKESGVNDELVSYEESTGTSIILLTEDKERTMNTFLGANRLFDAPDVNEKTIKKADLFYFTGYMWDTEPQKRAVLKVLEICKKHDIKIAFDIADPFAVARYHEKFIDLIKNYCDIVFANSEEARFLFNRYDAYECCKKLGDLCPIAIVKNGKKGSFISNNGKIINIPVMGTNNPIDTTGAGDTYAAGFLFGYSKSYSVETSGIIASYLAGEVIDQLGAQFSKEKINDIKEYLSINFTN